MPDTDENGRYYWLKLKRDFFKRHDIRIIEEMENGKDYILFYLKLLCESVDHEGRLRFSETVPYDEKMLSIITNTNVDIVRSAVQIFNSLGMMETLTDGTYFMREVEKLVGSETKWAEKKRQYRLQKGQTEDNVRALSDKSKSKSESKNKSIEIDINNTTGGSSIDTSTVEEREEPATAADELVKYAACELQCISRDDMEELTSYRDSFTDEMIRYAINEAVRNGSRKYSYVRRVLRRMLERGFKTLEEVEAAEAARQREKGRAVIRNEGYYDNSGELQ